MSEFLKKMGRQYDAIESKARPVDLTGQAMTEGGMRSKLRKHLEGIRSGEDPDSIEELSVDELIALYPHLFNGEKPRE